jgi:hypothetical protein
MSTNPTARHAALLTLFLMITLAATVTPEGDDAFDGGLGNDHSYGMGDGDDTCISVEVIDGSDCEHINPDGASSPRTRGRAAREVMGDPRAIRTSGTSRVARARRCR